MLRSEHLILARCYWLDCIMWPLKQRRAPALMTVTRKSLGLQFLFKIIKHFVLAKGLKT